MTRKMSLGLQKYMILKIFKKFNPDTDPQNLDLESLDSTCELSENLDDMENAYPQFVWKDKLPELEAADHDRQTDMLCDAGVEDYKVRERILSLYEIVGFSNDLLSELGKQEQRQVGEIFSKVVTIKSTTRKGKGKNTVMAASRIYLTKNMSG